MTDSMVDRVARAMERLAVYEYGEHRDSVSNWDYLARAAIEALREPTEAMTEAAEFGDYATGLSNGGDEHSFRYTTREDAARFWRAMVSAALKDAPANLRPETDPGWYARYRAEIEGER